MLAIVFRPPPDPHFERDTLLLAGVVALGLLAAAVLVLRGLRRKRSSDDHPHCRQCDYDLFGRPEGSTHCPECGADLLARRAVRTGVARPRRWPLVVGGLLVLAMIWPADAVHRRWEDAHWLRLYPVNWLLNGITSPASRTRSAAIDELARRSRDNQLSPADVAKVADRVLAVQADPKQPWDHDFYRLMGDDFFDRRLSPAKWEQCLRQGAPPRWTLDVRPRVRSGDPIPYRLVPTQGRHDVYRDSVRILEAEPGDRLSLDGIDLPTPTTAERASRRYDDLAGFVRTVPPNALTAVLTPGPHVLRLRGRREIVDQEGPPTAPVGGTDVDESTTFHVLPADTPSTTFDPNPAKPPGGYWLVAPREVVIDRTSVTVQFRQDTNDPQVNVAALVLLRAGDGREWPAGSIAHAINGSVTTTEDCLARGPRGDVPAGLTRVEVILRPDAAVAAGTVDVLAAWGSERVFAGIPVRYVTPERKTPSSAAVNWP